MTIEEAKRRAVAVTKVKAALAKQKREGIEEVTEEEKAKAKAKAKAASSKSKTAGVSETKKEKEQKK